MSETYYWSDLHLGHKFVAGLRGYADTRDHDLSICETILDTVGENDVLWLLGDISIEGSADHALRMLYKVREDTGATFHLVAGNHDKCWPGKRDSHKYQRDYMRVFESVQAFSRTRFSRMGEVRNVMMSHFPYLGDHSVRPHLDQYRLRDMGEWILHGHTHTSERVEGKQIHVGVDAWPAPVSRKKIEQIVYGEGQWQ